MPKTPAKIPAREQATSKAAGREVQPASRPEADGAHADVLALQRTIGNGAVSQLARERPEAELPAAIRDALQTPGRPLDAGTRGWMETRFGRDFSRVRIHADAPAAAAARSQDAVAFAAGEDLVFDSGQYQPDTIGGKMVIAHELAHTIQQSAGGNGEAGLDAGLEQGAEAAAHCAVLGGTAHVSPSRGAPPVQFLKVSNGAFGRALEEFTSTWKTPDSDVELLTHSPAFMRLVGILDANYLYYEDLTLEDQMDERRSNGRLSHRPHAGKRVLAAVLFDNPSFQPYEAPPEPDRVKLSGDVIALHGTDGPEFIQNLAHEITHAARFVTGSSPAPATIVEEVNVGVTDEIAARKSEAKILGEIPSKDVQARVATVGSQVPAEVEREISPAFGLTYLELFAFGRLLQEAQTADGLGDGEANDVREDVEKDLKTKPRPQTPFVINPHLRPKDVYRLSRYGDLWFFRRTAQFEWAEFREKHNPGDADFETAKEQLLQDHARRFFDGKVSYQALPKKKNP